MSTPKSIVFRGCTCPVLRQALDLLLVEGPRGQEWVKSRPMTRLRVFTESAGHDVHESLGQCVEYNGSVMLLTAMEVVGETGVYATLEEQVNDGSAELPLPFERFMASNGFRITRIDKSGSCFVPVEGPA